MRLGAAFALIPMGCTAIVGAPTTGDTAPVTSDSETATVTEDMVTLSEVQTQVFTPSCALAHCHDAEAQDRPVLVAGSAWSEIVGVESSAVNGAILVVPGEPTSSYLAMKLNGTTGIDGARMPFGGSLDPTLVTLVEKWILGGALDN